MIFGNFDPPAEYSGTPVASLTAVSKEAREELERCGFGDDDLQQLLQASDGVVEQFDAQGEPTSKVRVTQIDSGIFEFECVD